MTASRIVIATAIRWGSGTGTRQQAHAGWSAISSRSISAVELKGIAGPLQAWQVLRPSVGPLAPVYVHGRLAAPVIVASGAEAGEFFATYGRVKGKR